MLANSALILPGRRNAASFAAKRASASKLTTCTAACASGTHASVATPRKRLNLARQVSACDKRKASLRKLGNCANNTVAASASKAGWSLTTAKAPIGKPARREHRVRVLRMAHAPGHASLHRAGRQGTDFDNMLKCITSIWLLPMALQPSTGRPAIRREAPARRPANAQCCAVVGPLAAASSQAFSTKCRVRVLGQPGPAHGLPLRPARSANLQPREC